MMNAYQGFAGVYDEFMDNAPYEEWAERLDCLIKKYGVSLPERDAENLLDSEKNLVLDMGCGTGTLTELMYQKGYDMMGIDLSGEMLAVAMDKKAESGSHNLSAAGHERAGIVQHCGHDLQYVRFGKLHFGRG